MQSEFKSFSCKKLHAKHLIHQIYTVRPKVDIKLPVYYNAITVPCTLKYFILL